MKSSGSSQPGGSVGRFAALGLAGWSVGCSVWGAAAAGGGSAVRVRGVGMLMSRPVAARASKKRSSASARRMPRLRWARMVARLAVPNAAAMVGNVGAAARR